jgi:CBS domain-containing protein
MNRAASATLAGCHVREVVTVSRDTPVPRCAQLMHDEHVGSVVVVDEHDGRRLPVGMITDRAGKR